MLCCQVVAPALGSYTAPAPGPPPTLPPPQGPHPTAPRPQGPLPSLPWPQGPHPHCPGPRVPYLHYPGPRVPHPHCPGPRVPTYNARVEDLQQQLAAIPQQASTLHAPTATGAGGAGMPAQRTRRALALRCRGAGTLSQQHQPVAGCSRTRSTPTGRRWPSLLPNAAGRPGWWRAPRPGPRPAPAPRSCRCPPG